MAYIDGIKNKNTLYEIRDTKTASALNTLAEYGDAEIAIGSFVPGGINSNGQDINTSSQLTYSRRSKDFLPIETAPVIVHTKGGVTLYLRFFDDAGNILTNSENAAYISVGSSQSVNVNVQYSKTVDMTAFNSAAVKYKIIFAVAQNAESLPNLTVDNIRLSAGHKLATAGELAAVADQNLPNVWGLFRNAVCIGDSLTRGYYSAYASGERNRDYGYPSALARLTGMNVWNYGLSGTNPDEWLANATLAQEDYSRFDAAFIAFGQNRSTQTDAEYQEMYLNVLARLKTANPNMVIFCLSNPGPKQNTNIQAIVAAATASSGYSYVYFLDITGGDYAAHRTDGTHLDAIGYSLLAESVKIAVEKLYISDPSTIYIPLTKDNVITDPVNPLGEAEERINELVSYKRETYTLETNDHLWAQGGISSSTGAHYANSKRIRTQSIIPGYYGTELDDGYEAAIYAYADNNASNFIGIWDGKIFIKSSDVLWCTGSIWFEDINPNYYYKLAVKKTGAEEEDITPNENSHVRFFTKSAGQRLDDLESAVKSLGNLEKNRGLTPAQLQAICASGHAPDYFDIGDIIYIDWTDYTNSDNPVAYHVPHVVVHFGDVEDPEGNIHRNGMYLQWMYGTPYPIIFDEPEAVVANDATFQSGYYYYTKNTDGTYTEQEVTAGDTIPSGTTYYKHYRTGMAGRIARGSSDYSQSAYRQWLNSTAGVGEWWTAQHPSDVAPAHAATKPGFLTGYSSDWLAIFKPTKVQFLKDNTVDQRELAVMYDRFFLPSTEQVYGISTNGREGTYWEYWKELTGLSAPSAAVNERRCIPRMSDLTGAPVYLQLRTCYSSDSRLLYSIDANGSVGRHNANNNYCCLPATVIY